MVLQASKVPGWSEWGEGGKTNCVFGCTAWRVGPEIGTSVPDKLSTALSLDMRLQTGTQSLLWRRKITREFHRHSTGFNDTPQERLQDIVANRRPVFK